MLKKEYKLKLTCSHCNFESLINNYDIEEREITLYSGKKFYSEQFWVCPNCENKMPFGSLKELK